MQDEASKRRRLRADAEHFASLLAHPGFQRLQEYALGQLERDRESLVKRNFGVAPANQRDLDYRRGFSDGVKWIVSAVPRDAMRKLEEGFDEEATTAGGFE